MSGLRPAPPAGREDATRGPLRLAFVGTGWIGRHRLQAIARSGLASVEAICDPDAGARAAAQAIAPRAELLDDLDDLFRGQAFARGLDGVVIATPSALHAPQALRALEHGLAVYCQKPLARTADEARAVVDAARQANRLLGLDLCYRQTRAMQAIAALIRSGELGRVHAVDLTFHNSYGPDKPWFYEAALSGGGCLIDLGVHLLDLALWVLDFPPVCSVQSHLLAAGRTYRGAPEVEDYAIAQVELSGGVLVRLACSWNLPLGRDCQIACAFHGDRGGALFHNVNGSFYDFRAERYVGRACELLVEPPDDWGGRGALAWTRALVRSTDFDVAAEHYVALSTLIDAAYGRAADRRPAPQRAATNKGGLAACGSS